MRNLCTLAIAIGLVGSLSLSTASAQNQGRIALAETTASPKATLSVKEAVVKQLMLANHMEVELGKLAQQKSKNQRVSSFADTLVEDHRQLNDTLKSWLDSNQDKNKTATPPERPRTLNQPPQRLGSAANTIEDKKQRSRKTQASSQTVPPTLFEIAEQASDNALNMTKQMLQNYEGDEFDMAFVGQQTIAHIMLLAELRAIEQQNFEKLSEIARAAATTTEQHLEELKQMAKELKDNS